MAICETCQMNVVGVCINCTLSTPLTTVQLPQPPELPQREVRRTANREYRPIVVRSCAQCPFAIVIDSRRWCTSGDLLEMRLTHEDDGYVASWCPLRTEAVRVQLASDAVPRDVPAPVTPPVDLGPKPDLWAHLTDDLDDTAV